MINPTLEQRIRRLEDLEAITTLTARYGRAVDKRPGHRIDLAAIPHIFTTDARCSSVGLGTTVGASARMIHRLGVHPRRHSRPRR